MHIEMMLESFWEKFEQNLTLILPLKIFQFTLFYILISIQLDILWILGVK